MTIAVPAPPLHDPSVPPRLATALAGSLALHAALVALLAAWVGIGGSGPGSPFTQEPLQARLLAPATPAPSPEAPQPPMAPSALAPSTPAPSTAPLPVPLRPRRESLQAPTGEGRVAIHPDDGAAVDESLTNVIAALYPGARREPANFEKFPVGDYPEAARRERRQLVLRVVVVVKEDGAVELAEGTFDDPLFAPAIRAALATAKAKPLVVDGTPRPTWSVLTFHFEFYAAGESQRTKYEEMK